MNTSHRRSHTIHEAQLRLLELVLGGTSQLVLRIRQLANRLHIILSLLVRGNTAVLLHRTRTRVITGENHILQLILIRGVLRQTSTQLSQVACLRRNRIVRVQNITAVAEAVVAAAPRIISELCNTLSALVGHNAHTPVAFSFNLRCQHAGTETRDLRALLKIGSESRRSIRKLRHTAIVVIGGCQTGNTATQKNRRGKNLPMRECPGEKAKRESFTLPRRSLFIRRSGSVVGGARSVTLGRGARSAICHSYRLAHHPLSWLRKVRP